ncbi:receptor-type tyrosine-protein phosphatase kappa-like [Ostrea edulis]|uniref:receptor-type tyrosine-protein phosphatase kappa-like n=1 Tax=Ostrea edulis TaxID=37623 RepID=UPI0024AFE9CD|nr:receptor-type tyrosine-protein phosphatase kappa-like [Ostrea edulis]
MNFQFSVSVHSLKVSTADSQKAIIGGTVSTAAVLLILGAVLIIILRRRMSKSDSASERSDVQNFTFRKGLNKSRANQYANISGTHQNITETQSDASCNVPEIKETEDGGYYNTVQINTDIRIEDLQDVILRKSEGENNTFLHEYKKFPPGDVNICQTAKKTDNVVKNRFKTTFPYEHSRVVLKEKWSDSENDYINANFIKDCNGEKIYIAAQGPKNNTLTDFWRMIWQESIETIVMLTNLIENGKNKCTQYWPEKGKVMEVGPCKVTLVKETAYSFHIVRILSVQRKNSPNKRRISQFHYIAWPDHGTPEELGLAQFHSVVTRACSPGTPCLVHCSAGVGRTGTYIALDSLLKHGKETERINVFEFVKKMREDRMTMVQTPEQYVFLHKALLCGFQDKNTLVPESDFLAKTTKLLNDTSPLNQRHLYEEFKFLSELKPVHEKNEEAENAENREKNVTMDILPVSKYQPFLTTFVKGRNDYINAIRVPSFTNSTGFIMTQMPLSGTEVDLWRLCMDHDAEAMVILNDNSEDIAWLPRRGLSQSCPPFILRTGNTGSDMNGVSQDSLTISCNEQKRTIDVFQMPSGNDNSMLKGTDLLLEKGKESNFTMIVISRNGAGATGIFCVLHNALQQLRMDGEVDIFTAVRQIQTRRPEVITDLEAYRRCYHLMSLFLSEDGIYANM